MVVDSSSVLVAGPWEHRYVAANGARFHVAEAGEGPLVLFLHGFPQFWWTWRHQIPAVAAAGYRAVALDLRGYGASDKPPVGYSPADLCADVAGVIRSLGEDEAVVVGHGAGGWLAWSLPSLQPQVVRGLVAVGCPHPAAVLSARLSGAHLRGARAIFEAGRPLPSERDPEQAAVSVRRILSGWRGQDSTWPDEDTERRYVEAMAIPFVAHAAGESYRRLTRAWLRPSGRDYLRMVRRPVPQPVLQVCGSHDQVSPPALATAAASSDRFEGPAETRIIQGAGHAPQEQEPAATSGALVDWLGRLGAHTG